MAETKKDWSSAATLWGQVAEGRVSDSDAWVRCGTAQREGGDLARSKESLARAIAINPESVQARVLLAELHELSFSWREAALAWNDAARVMAADDRGSLQHAFSRALITACETRDSDLIARLSMAAAVRAPQVFAIQENALLRSRLIRHSDPKAAKALLLEVIERSPQDDAAAFDLASTCLDDGDYATGIRAIEQCLAVKPMEASFLWLAADLYERIGDKGAAIAFCKQMTSLPSPEDRASHRIVELASSQGDLTTARAYAVGYAKANKGELILIGELLRAYEDAGDYRHARLICRLLVRRWSHSEWHRAKLINLTARTLGIVAADRLVRAFNVSHGPSSLVDRAYAEAPFFAGQFSEAVRRLEWLLAKSQVGEAESSAVLLGYALANASGIRAAETQFAKIATTTYQSNGALVGLAHMASRRRDYRAALDLWAKISALYPENTIAGVEHARAAYNYGDTKTALQVSARRMATVPTDVTMAEFYAWLLIALGQHQKAREFLNQFASGPNWALLESLIHAVGVLERLDDEWPRISSLLPQSSSEGASQKLYQVIRLLVLFSREDLAAKLLALAHVQPRHLAWLASYLPAIALQPQTAARVVHFQHEIQQRVAIEPAERLRTMSDDEVQTVLGRPRFQQPRIHIINKFEQVRGGSELHALDLANVLSKFADVELWAPEMPHPEFSVSSNVKAVDHSQGNTPYDGVIVFIGVYFSVSWLERTRPSRILFLYNTFELPSLYAKVSEAFRLTGVKPEVIFCSNIMRAEAGIDGLFEPSPTDLEVFYPERRDGSRLFTVGRHSRDVPEKHHPEDGVVYETASQLGGRSEILGGRCMSPTFGTIANLNLLPARVEGVADFLRQLDVYYYRTSSWVEPWGRVVIEAMACGLPVVLHQNAGCAQVIEHGRNGFLFDTTSEAVDLIRRLHASVELRHSIGHAARLSVEKLLGPTAWARQMAFYLIDRDTSGAAAH